MKINEFINESTTAGSIATVAAPMTTQKRNNIGKGVYGNEKPGTLLTGKKTNKKYANSVNESAEDKAFKQGRNHGLKGIDDNRYINRKGLEKQSNAYVAGRKEGMKLKKEGKTVNESKMKQVASDLETMQDGNFKQKYGKTKEQIKMLLGDPGAKKTMHEAHLEEDDLILVPGQGHRLKSGFIPHKDDRTDHEVEMAKSDLFQAAKNAKQVYEMIADVSEDEGLEGWVQEKIIKANDYLNTVREYLEGKQVQEMTGGVIAGGGVGESKKNNKLSWHAKLVNWGKDGHPIITDINWDSPGEDALVAQTSNGEAVITWDESARRFILTVNGKQYDVPGSHKYPTQAKELAAKILSGVTENLANWNMGVQSIPRTSEWKRKAITAVMPGAMGKEYTFDTEQEAIQHFGKDAWEKIKAGVPTKSGKPWEVIYADDVTEGIKEKIKGAVRREKAKDLPLLQTRRDYAMGKAGDAYNKGETRKGNQYSAWAEKDRKKKNDPTTNPAGTYRTKTSDYTNENAWNQLGQRKPNTNLPAPEKGSRVNHGRHFKEGDIVLPLSGPLKGQPHKVIHSQRTSIRIVPLGRNTYPGDTIAPRTKHEWVVPAEVNEAQSMGTALKNSLAKAEPGSKLDNSIKAHNRNIKAGNAGTLKNAPTGYHFDKKGYCRLGDK